ncbi:MAG: hypothetical protein HQL69_16990 [Magnetococcales bacterium]|nr:hypothetical protein [Magnetococcales bacterium]
MDAFLRKHQSLLLSTLFMVAGLLTAGYATIYSGKQAMIDDLRIVRKELVTRKSQLKALQQKSNDEQDKIKASINSLPTFLSRINEIANNNDVIIRKLSPDSSNSLKFILEIVTDYFTFIRFTSDLESLDIVLDDIQLHPYDVNSTPPTHAISFSLIPRNDANPLSDNSRLKELKQWVSQKDKRNPFQRFAYDSSRKRVRPVIDLTWIYKLGGLGLTTEGVPYATIDRKNYIVGEKLFGYYITKIERDRVYLEKRTADGNIRYSLGFRKRAGENKK